MRYPQGPGIEPTDTIVAYNWSVVRWRLNARVLDMYGFTNEEMAHSMLPNFGLRQAERHLPLCDMILRLKPRYIVVPNPPYTRLFLRDPRFRRNYRLLHSERYMMEPHRLRLPNMEAPFLPAWFMPYARVHHGDDL